MSECGTSLENQGVPLLSSLWAVSVLLHIWMRQQQVTIQHPQSGTDPRMAIAEPGLSQKTLKCGGRGGMVSGQLAAQPRPRPNSTVVGPAQLCHYSGTIQPRWQTLDLERGLIESHVTRLLDQHEQALPGYCGSVGFFHLILRPRQNIKRPD